MTLTPIRGTDFVSTSLDQTVNVWEGGEGKLRGTLPGPQVGYDILTITIFLAFYIIQARSE